MRHWQPLVLTYLGLAIMGIPGLVALGVYGLARLYASGGAEASPLLSLLGFGTVVGAIVTGILVLVVLPLGIGLTLWGFIQARQQGRLKPLRGPMIAFAAMLAVYAIGIVWFIRL